MSAYRNRPAQSGAVAQAQILQQQIGHRAAWEFLCQRGVPAAVLLRVLSRQGPRRSGDTQVRDSGVEAPVPAPSALAILRRLPLLRGQRAAVMRFLAAARRRGEPPDPAELAGMLRDMLVPPATDSDDEGDPPALRALTERAAGWGQDGIDADSVQEERLAAAEAEAMKRG